MKIVIFCEFYIEAWEYQENILVKYYLKHGYDVTIITSTFESASDFINNKYDAKAAKTYTRDGIKIIRLPYKINIVSQLRFFSSIYNIFVQERPDIIFVHDIMLNIFDAVKYKKLHPSCTIILDYHGDYSNSANSWLSLKILHGIFRKFFLDKSRKYISKIFPITPATATFLNEVYKVPHSEMELLPLGADTDLGCQTKNNKEGLKLREKFGIPKNDIVIFTGGKFDPKKKTELLIEAFKTLQRDNIHLIIIGDAIEPSNKEYKNQLINHCKGIKTIHFTGWVNSSNIYPFLDMADLAVFPASQSILWQQAISMELPLIVGNTGHQDISYLNLYENIVILKQNQINIEQIRESIQRIIDDNALRAQMGLGAKKVTQELLNWDVLIHKTLI